MRIGAHGVVAVGVLSVVAMLTASIGCGGAGLFRQYEYEEEMYLSLDGSATVYVNTSIAALNALHRTSFDATPPGRFDRDAYRRYYSSPNTHVTRVTSSRRSGRRFVHVRLDVDDVRRLGEAQPFAWSMYRFDRSDDHVSYVQVVDGNDRQKPSLQDQAGGDAERAEGSRFKQRWTGSELVAFRLHLPSKIAYHNAPPENLRRGNILVWEQPLSDRLRGVPLAIEARIETESILNQTLWLFGISLLAVATAFGAAIWWVVRRGTHQESWHHVDPI